MGRPGLTNHRKFRRLTRALGSPIVARGVLELVWDAAYECGDDYLGTAADIEQLVAWAGEPGTLVAAEKLSRCNTSEAGSPYSAPPTVNSTCNTLMAWHPIAGATAGRTA